MLFDCRTDSIDSPLLAFESAAKALVHLAQRGYDGNQHEAGGGVDFMSQPTESTDDSSGGAETTSSAKSVTFADTSSSPSPSFSLHFFILAGISKAAQWIERFCASNLNQCRGTEGGCWVLWDTLLIRVECMVGGATH